VPSPERRPGLGAPKVARRHPAEPVEFEQVRPGRAVRDSEGLVMLCVRVTPSLRRRLKLVSAMSGNPIQALATEAFELVCRQYDL
jgi:hypothetical protein